MTTEMSSRWASREMAEVLRQTFPSATDINFEALARTIVDRLNLAVVTYVDERHEAFDVALKAMMEYDGIIKRSLHERIANLEAELEDCNKARAKFIKGEVSVNA